jgi:predicted PurR-regulated permease PerM
VDEGPARSPALSARTKQFVLVLLVLLAIFFFWQIRSILSPFLWALVAAYLLSPVVNYLSVRGGLPRLWAVILIYACVALLLLSASAYLYPKAVEQVNVFLEDIPRIEGSLIDLVGPRPLGIDIDSVVREIVRAASNYASSSGNASHLLINAVETVFKIFLFLVSTFYLLMDGPRLRSWVSEWIPDNYRPEILALGRQINLTWQQYIRGELLLFALMTTVTTIGLTILQVPGAIFLGFASGLLELLPLVGPWTAGALAVAVAYFNGTNPWGTSQIAYAGIVALMYFVLRQAEDYFVIPHVIGRAVRLPPILVLFSLTAGGVFGGVFGLIIAVPAAASLKAIFSYLYAKFVGQPVVFEPVQTLGGGLIEVEIVHDSPPRPYEGTRVEGPGTP